MKSFSAIEDERLQELLEACVEMEDVAGLKKGVCKIKL